MPERGRLRIAFFAAAALLAVAGVVLFATAPKPEGKAARDPGDAARLDVIALRIESRPVPRLVQKTGVLEPSRRLELISETRGRIVELGAEELDRVEPGQLIVRVDPTLAEVAVERAEAAVARAESQLEFAAREQQRWGTLAERDAGSLSRRDDTANAERVARADLRDARASLVEARDSLSKKTLAAPFAGVLRDLPVEVGEVLQEGKHVGELLDLRRTRLMVGLSDREIVGVSSGRAVDVVVEALPGRTGKGNIARVGAAADPETKKFPVEIEIENPEGDLLPGMVAHVVLSLGDPEPATLVPRDATFDQHGLRFVYVLEAAEGNGVYRAKRRRVEVRPLPSHPTDFQVVEGLAPGERIAGSHIRELRDGVLVRGREGA